MNNLKDIVLPPGTKLIAIANFKNIKVGDIGTIIRFNGDDYVVKFDNGYNYYLTKELRFEGHSLCGLIVCKIYDDNLIVNKEVKIEVPEGYEIDKENSSFTCIKFKKEAKKEVTCWEDLDKIKGYLVSEQCDIREYITDGLYTKTSLYNSRNLFATKEQASACIALAMLSQLMKAVNGDWIPDWQNHINEKYSIRFSRDVLAIRAWSVEQSFLAFPTEEIRDKFLKNHRELIMQAKPLL